MAYCCYVTLLFGFFTILDFFNVYGHRVDLQVDIKIDDMITMNVLQRQGTGLNLQSWKRLQYQLYHCPKVKLLIITKSFWILCFIASANAPWSWLKYLWFNLTLTMIIRGGAIAQWIRLHLPSCDPGFESQSHNLCYYIVKFCAIFVLRKGRK